jgi:hypothetical protein
VEAVERLITFIRCFPIRTHPLSPSLLAVLAERGYFGM